MMNLVETLEGKGTGVAATGKTPVQYRLLVYQNQIPDGLGGTIAGLKEIHGRILPVFGDDREMLTLEMKDARTVKFYFRDGDGNVLATGGIT
jgi:hypothetical protein